MYDVEQIRKDFPVLRAEINGHRNTFLDTAASAQKPRVVVEKMADFYLNSYANVHRGSYLLSELSTEAYEQARKAVQKFLNALKPDEIVFTRNATESINLVASSWGEQNLCAGDEVLISQAEHHANLVPWQNIWQTTT